MELVLSRKDQVVVVANVFSQEVKICDIAEEFYDRIRAAEDQRPPIAVGGWVRRHFVAACTGMGRKAQAKAIRQLRDKGLLAVAEYKGEQWCQTLPRRTELAPPTHSEPDSRPNSLPSPSGGGGASGSGR